MLYQVSVPIFGHHRYLIDAENETDAIKLVEQGGGDIQDTDNITEHPDTGEWYATLAIN